MYAANTSEHWAEIRDIYSIVSRGIEKTPANRFVVDPHFWCGTTIELSLIERMIWDEARAVGIVLYPQFPIDRFFADFANPAAKVVIECDGEEFHKDGAADRARERVMEGLGWHVYRISGAACHRAMFGDGHRFNEIDWLFSRICSEHPEMASAEMASRLRSARKEFQQ